MVDGQQRAITIYKFIKNEFRDSSKRYYKDYNENTFMNYRINVVLLEEFNGSTETKEEFFYLVNKRGVQLNPSEVIMRIIMIQISCILSIECPNINP